MAADLQIVDGTIRWKATDLKFDAMINGERRSFAIDVRKLTAVDFSDPEHTLFQSLPALRAVIIAAGADPGLAERKIC
ncbi:hypothetical protein [Sphingomonas glacialis]|uniref:hypothetical protein n=1 Tax=Sphingomonas glacialis TaxID=658225 RepID=UPI00112B958D|nr:hypothetical protein [Sphingomonas glacialis]